MAGWTYSTLTTDIRNYTEVDSNVFTTAVINRFIFVMQNIELHHRLFLWILDRVQFKNHNLLQIIIQLQCSCWNFYLLEV